MTVNDWKEKYFRIKRVQGGRSGSGCKDMAGRICYVNRFCRAYGAVPLDGFPRTLAREYADSLYAAEPKLAPDSIRVALSYVTNYFAVAVEYEECSENPFKDIKRPPRNLREVYLSPDEAARLLGCADAATLPALITALYAGIRRGALCALNVEDVRLDAGTIRKRREHAKGGKTSHIPMHPCVRAALEPLVRDRFPGEPLFVDENGLRFRPRQLSFRFAKARRAAKFPYVHLHDLRHTFANWLLDAGVNLMIIRDAMDHTDIQTTQRYLHVNGDMVERAVAQLPVLPLARTASGALWGATA